ncbi:MAG: hypothetical protein R3251_01980 [Candidatus Spechtbacterales bacterium]|nr:hypothetical protein [Candidatus Spechtbacterales bacterium]
MTKTVKTSLLVIIAGLLIGGILFMQRSGKNLDPISFIYNLASNKNSPEDNKESVWPRYNQRTIGISFQHPREWGSLRFSIEPCVIEGVSTGALQDEPCMHVFLMAPDLEGQPLFMVSQSTHFADNMRERDPYFGDIFSLAQKEDSSVLEFMENYCTEQAPLYDAQNCIRAVNPNGVRYVKTLQNPFYPNERTEGKKIFYYLIHQPDSHFEGIVMSSQLLMPLYNPENLENVMDKIMASVTFLESNSQ